MVIHRWSFLLNVLTSGINAFHISDSAFLSFLEALFSVSDKKLRLICHPQGFKDQNVSVV